MHIRRSLYLRIGRYAAIQPSTQSQSTSGPTHITPRSTITLLVSCSRTRASELLGLAAAIVGHQQRAVVLHQGLLQLVLGVLVDILLVVGHDGLGYGLSDGVDL